MQNTLENNKLIGEFMQWKDLPTVYLGSGAFTFCNGFDYVEKTMFHKSWDWLMPVVEKIERIKPDGANWIYCVTIEREYCVISENGEAPIVENQYEEGDKLKAVYDTIVEFIKWYNLKTE